MTYAHSVDRWMTPGGHMATFTYRERTNDWNVLSSVNVPGDEYRLPTGLTGWALDIGGHIGAVTVALALDNPDLSVLCIEPIPDNLGIIRENIAWNGLGDRVRLVDGVAGTDPLVTFGGEGEPAEHHAFVGNNQWALTASGAETVMARCYSLAAIIRSLKAASIAFMKIDCEGCEWSFLDSPAIAKVERIVGEWHPPGTVARLRALLERTHDVTLVGEHGFEAVRRA
ncbi:MAG TPA: FkbM family methyltransferase [Verrucomicrobiae bacterium]|nr:FkbM family methyltransferase [Verrucomicrobiae bacterium]